MKKNIIFALVILLGGFLTNNESANSRDFNTGMVAPGKTGAVNQEEIITKAASIAVPFVKNAGQFDAEVKYAADLFAGRFFLTGKELVYSLHQREKADHVQPGKHRLMSKAKKRDTPGKGIVFKEYFVDQKGAKIDLKSSGEQQAETIVSYFKGRDATKWHSGVPSYQSVSLGEVYPGVEVKLKATGRNVEKVFYVSPRSSVEAIKIGIAGVAGLKLADDGRLLLKNTLGELAMRAPVAWQEIAGQRHEVKVGYHLLGDDLYGFAVLNEYDKKYPLIIDPDLDTLLASTYLGGEDCDYTSYDADICLVLGPKGNIYLLGTTESDDLPTTPGAYDRKLEDYASDDIFISKFNGSLTTLLASTYLGGMNGDYGLSLVQDKTGNVFLTGYTWSYHDFPTIPGAYIEYSDVDEEVALAFISKLNGGLTKLLASTLLGDGGPFDENGTYGHSLALDSSGNIYLTGQTASNTFPTTPGAYDQTYNWGRADVFISKLDRDLTTLLASTFLGGKNCESGHSIVLDSADNVYLTGITYSSDFPTTPGAYNRHYNGGCDVFVAKLNSSLTTLLASTLLGGSYWDHASSLALDSSGNVYLTGYTDSSNFPTTPGTYDQTYNWGSYDVFVSKLNSSLTALLASTYLGGSNQDYGSSLRLDSDDNVYLTGTTYSKDFPNSTGAYDRIYNGEGDAFVSKLNGSLTTLLASTFLGGRDWDNGISLTLDSSSNVYLTGYTKSTDFPTTPGAYDRSYNSRTDKPKKLGDVFVSKLSNSLSSMTVTSPNGGESWIAGKVHNITWKSTGTIANVKIEVSINNGSSWSDVISATANDCSHAWTIPNTPSLQCLVRISDVANEAMSDTSDAVFAIMMSIDLLAERREARAFSILRQYGQIQFLAGNGSGSVAQYNIMRRQGSGAFALLRAVAPSELRNNLFQMQDKYLEKDIIYTYRVEAYDAAGQLIGISLEKTI